MPQLPTFEELFRDCRRSAVHLEMRDGYMKSDPAFVDWSAGRPIDPAERWGDWLRLVSEATARGVEVRRARIMSEPVSDYIHFEYDVTDGLNIAAGEQVRWLPRRRATSIALPGNDFWVFDTSLVLLNHFDGNGDSLEHEVTTDPDITELCTSAFEAVWDRAIPHTEYRPT
ncbi:DUF6879 family protein [Streptomyces sp. DT24]|uniref:DUF6879 family protein n=1 Tax=unclassified Streptomyces TaxID=2593676 RepID=UPI0023B9BD91|nr:DUF6879 family protein [Streptomyces sp. AM 4-1-1]WEH34672.1 hypothetical protein PZB75_15725 [Streptomyces sp. AM 4-1-1]